jgi:hypothetical protein
VPSEWVGAREGKGVRQVNRECEIEDVKEWLRSEWKGRGKVSVRRRAGSPTRFSHSEVSCGSNKAAAIGKQQSSSDGQAHCYRSWLFK